MLVPGGFFGVDVFFVVSGFVIAHLLLRTLESDGDRFLLRVRTFFSRRLWRLWPALAVFLVVVCAFSFLFDSSRQVGRHALATAAGFANWFEISAADSGSNSPIFNPLRHTWSLSIEEQFYLVLPPLVFLAGRRWARRTILSLAAFGIAVSLVAALSSYTQPREYFGTDTRLAALSLGIALAAAPPTPHRWFAISVPQAIGLFSGVALCYVLLTVRWSDAWVYNGGFLVVAALSAGLISAIVALGDANRWTAPFRSRPALWAGTRSYALYIWHHPLIGLDFAGGRVSALLCRLAFTGVLAELSYRFVEQPLRIYGRTASTRWLALPIAVAALATVLLVALY